MTAPLVFDEVPLGRVVRTSLGGLPGSGAEVEGPFSLEVAARLAQALGMKLSDLLREAERVAR